jgi:hypothetical protein
MPDYTTQHLTNASRRSNHGIPDRQTFSHHRRRQQPLHRLGRRPGHAPRGRASWPFPTRAKSSRAGWKIWPQSAIPISCCRWTSPATSRSTTASPPSAALGRPRRHRARHRLRAQGGTGRQLRRRADPQGLHHRPRDQFLQLRRTGQGRTHTDGRAQRRAGDHELSRRRTRGAQLQRHGRRQGQPGGQRALPGRGARPRRAPASTASPPDRSAPWPRPASRTSARC